MKYKIVNMKRFIISITIVVVILFVSIVGLVSFLNNDKYEMIGTETYIVKPGDTLWEICRNRTGGMNIEQYIYNVEELNNITANLQPGQMIELPIYN